MKVNGIQNIELPLKNTNITETSFCLFLVWEEKIIQVWNDIWRSKLFWLSFPFKSQLPKYKSGLLNINQIMTKCASLAQQPMLCEIRLNQVFHAQNTDIIC